MTTQQAQNAINQLSRFVAFPTVSAQPERYGHYFGACARWLATYLKQIGLKNSRIVQTDSHGQYPIVRADWLGAGRDALTVLLYGHYDVQPPDPLAEWHSYPFQPIVRGHYLYGRGVSDDKGQIFIHLKAIEQLLSERRRLPVNIKCLFEGAEEIGSPQLPDYLEHNRFDLQTDIALVSDTAMPSAQQPALMYGLRGTLYVELTVWHDLPDLHSGNFGGAFQNPLQVICWLLGQMRREDGSIAVDGFYENIAPISAAEKRIIRQNAVLGTSSLENSFHLPVGGEPLYSLYERIAVRPSLTVCGVSGGYFGKGLKAVIPSKAVAKLDFRLVPNQNPHFIFEKIRTWVQKKLPPTMHFSLEKKMAIPAVVTSTEHYAVKAAYSSLESVYGKKPLLLRSGGTVPIVSLLKQKLSTPSVLMGFGLPDDRIHAPNERFYLPNFFKGIEASRLFFEILSKNTIYAHH